MTKQVVKYDPKESKFIKIGYAAEVTPIDHPDEENVSNFLPVTTSTVIAYDETTGEFETRNTLYKPA